MTSISRTTPVLVCLLAAVAAGSASATISSSAHYAPCGSSEGANSKGIFDSLVTYTYSGSGTSASVTVLLTNTTLPANGGLITGLALNPDPLATGLVFNSCTNAAFIDCGTPVSAAPFGSFVVGAALGGNWLGGGSPNAGIAVGGSATFTFTISGSAALLGAMTAEDVFNDENDRAMVVRFRGGVGGWSDKVLGCAMPAPGMAAFLGVGGLVGARRRRA
jgi:hypothetical protein